MSFARNKDGQPTNTSDSDSDFDTLSVGENLSRSRAPSAASDGQASVLTNSDLIEMEENEDNASGSIDFTKIHITVQPPIRPSVDWMNTFQEFQKNLVKLHEDFTAVKKDTTSFLDTRRPRATRETSVEEIPPQLVAGTTEDLAPQAETHGEKISRLIAKITQDLQQKEARFNQALYLLQSNPKIELNQNVVKNNAQPIVASLQVLVDNILAILGAEKGDSKFINKELVIANEFVAEKITPLNGVFGHFKPADKMGSSRSLNQNNHDPENPRIHL
jgi:hypothetical protein